ncbi:MAG: S66 peptidase family protein [Bacillota bacterium]
MTKIPPIKKGAKIGIVAPASPPNIKKLEKGIKFLKDWGLKVQEAPHLREVRGYLAGEDKERAADLHEFFSNNNIDAIWCAGGGYGTPRLLQILDYDLIKKNPKPFIGYSDITALHLAFNKFANLITFHGPMIATELGDNPDEITIESIKKILFNDYTIDFLKEFKLDELEIINSGIAEGEITGGNLALLAATIGTPYELQTDNKLLFIEDIGEEAYSIDRMLSQLKNAAKLDNLAGLIIGNFTDSKAKSYDPSLTVDEIINDYFADKKYPIIRHFPFGHDKTQLTIPLGVRAKLDTLNNSLKII